VRAMEALIAKYPKQEKYLKYGTAGFRDNVNLPLHSVFTRVGLFASHYSRHHSGKCIGVMITASHNPEQDNGIKIVDVDGGMLSQSMEPLAEQIANVDSLEDLQTLLNSIEDSTESDGSKGGGLVLIGRDTRPHSVELSQCVQEGVQVVEGTLLDLGEVTTPQLHFIVQEINTGRVESSTFDSNEALDIYYKHLLGGYKTLCDTISGKQSFSLVVDASNGVGSIALERVQSEMISVNITDLTLNVQNIARSKPVNLDCGAEYVQKGQQPPSGIDMECIKGQLVCSFDGDADRIVFHGILDGQSWALLDGDKIACLFAATLMQELRASGLDSQFKFGVVQTAYANGASTRFLESHQIQVAMAKTGVKYLHHEALAFDIGVYFEANGHGTVLFSDSFLKVLKEPKEEDDDRISLAYVRLQAFTQVINQTVGDAVSDMLTTLACLNVLGMTPLEWQAMYVELPSRQLKVPHANKQLIKCSNDETRCIAPVTLTNALDEAMQSVRQGRCFVRPSGTEDVVRVYSEAATQEEADSLASLAVDAIKQCLD
jgi:phosphoacetylglucosamine mutase